MPTVSAGLGKAERSVAHARIIPAEVTNIVGTSGALLAVVATGAGISAALPEPSSAWLFAAAYGAPAAVAFAVYWWIAQRL
jgi:hypothetical protein